MEKLKPLYLKLSPNEQLELASVTTHPGMAVLVHKIIGVHARQQLEMVHSVNPDDPARVIKLDAICATAYAMKLMYELVQEEMGRNLKMLREQEAAQKKTQEPDEQ